MEEITVEVLESAVGGLTWRDEEKMNDMIRNAKSLRWSKEDFKTWMRKQYTRESVRDWLNETLQYIDSKW